MSKQLTRAHKKVITLSSVGGMLEFYDFIIFVFFASSIAKLFFPVHMSGFWSNLNTYATFAAGYFARPVGGVIMAHFGDKLGRKKMFVLSMMLMVVPTFLVGIMPTFETIGYLAPAILIIVRIMQGIAIGGELPGAWTFVSEHVHQRNLGLSIGILTSSITAGVLLGSIVSFTLHNIYTQEEIDDYAWRIPFIVGGVFGIVSIVLRMYLEETPVFKEMESSKKTVEFPLKEVFKKNKPSIAISMVTTWMLAACVMIYSLLLPVNLHTISSLTIRECSMLQIVGTSFLSIGCVVFGILNDRTSTRNAGFVFSIGLMICSILFFKTLFNGSEQASAFAVSALYVACCFFCGLSCFTPLVMLQVFPPATRFSGIGFSYNVGYAIFGGPTPIFFQIALGVNSNLFMYYFVIVTITAMVCAMLYDKIKVE